MEPSIPIELVEEFEKGNVLLWLGHGSHTQLQPVVGSLIQEIANRVNYPDQEQLSLGRVAQFYELKRSRPNLITLLKDRLRDTSPVLLHERLVDLMHAGPGYPVREIVTLHYDDALERTLQARKVSFTPIIRTEDIPFNEETQPLVLHLWGRLDQPDSLVITTDDKTKFATQHGSLYRWIVGDLAQRTWLCLGVDLEDPWFQQLYDNIFAPLGEFGRRAYTVGAPASEFAHLWWQKRNMELLEDDIIPFIDAFISLLQQRARQRSRLAPTNGQRKLLPSTPPKDVPLAKLPYRELRYYEPEDEDLFFGREAEKYYLLQQILANRLTIVTGPSGAGKSSLLNAGIIPRLQREGFAVGTARLIGDPLSRLVAEAIRPLTDQGLIEPPEATLRDYLHVVSESVGREIVLIIDQFEEFFARPLGRETKKTFLAALSSVIIDRSLKVRIILSLRADWVHALRILDEWLPDAMNYEVRIRRLSLDQARQAFVGPLEYLGIPYEAPLVDEILADLLQETRGDEALQTDSLFEPRIDPPQLQLVCHALYSTRVPTGLTVAMYEEIGQARGILQGYLRRKLSAFGREELLARRILEALVTPWDTKAARTLEEVWAEVGDQLEVIAPMLNRLVDARLLQRDMREGKAYFELAHEYLVDEINLTEEMRSLKRAEHWLEQGAEEWVQGQTLLGVDQFRNINRERDRFRPPIPEWSDETQALLLRCALQYDIDVAYWVQQVQTSQVQKAILLEVLWESEDPQARATAATMLHTLHDEEVVEALLEAALVDKAPDVRRAAAQSLKGSNEATLEALLAEAGAGSDERTIHALEALGYAGGAAEIPPLMAIAVERDLPRRAAALASLDRLEPPATRYWFWLRNRELLIGDTTLFLTVLLVVLVGLHYLVINALGNGTAALTTSLQQAVFRNPLLLSFRLQWTAILPLTLLALVMVGVARTYHALDRLKLWSLLVVILLVGVGNFFYRPVELYVAQNNVDQVYSRAEYELVNAQEPALARRFFEDIPEDSKERVVIEAWLAGIHYLEGDYVTAIRDSCTWLANEPDVTSDYDTIAPSLVTTVHWSLYQLGHTLSRDEAANTFNQLQAELHQSQPDSLCVKNRELSAYFLGISPENRSFMLELVEKYAPPPLYRYLGLLSGQPERYPLPPGATLTPQDQALLQDLVESGLDHKYGDWAAFLLGRYDHWLLSNTYTFPYLDSAASLAQAVNNLSLEPAMGLAQLNHFLEAPNQKENLLDPNSPWLDDLYALQMYLWAQYGDIDQALTFYVELSKLESYDVLCRFCSPGVVLGLNLSTTELEELLSTEDRRLDLALCNAPHFVDLLGLRQLADGQYEAARTTLAGLTERCGVRYPGLDAQDYVHLVDLVEMVETTPTKENYRQIFTIMDQTWTWGYDDEIPSPSTWFLQQALFRTNNWPVDVFLEINPWVTYAELLEDYEARFRADAAQDVRVPASLLQAAWIYDVLATAPGELLDETSAGEYRQRLHDRAASALTGYLERYYERDDVPVEFCRYYRGPDANLLNYNLVQDCVMEWLALLYLSAPGEGDVLEQYEEADIVSMQSQARTLVSTYPEHHLANNLLTWIAWGYSYRANLYPVRSHEYIDNYSQALLTYEELLENYPTGEQATNARENIPLIQEKIRNPDARQSVPLGRWTWDLPEKTISRFEDILGGDQ